MSHTTFLAGANLRWVTRTVFETDSDHYGNKVNIARTVRVLQQGLRPVNGGPVQWFDVPEEDEVPL